ncbi:MAG: hypothetical protein U0744_02940 [Gemmataceae bacterium]
MLASDTGQSGPQSIRRVLTPAAAAFRAEGEAGARHFLLQSALGHLDTFDYKPELVRRHDTPMPNAPQITFQGAQTAI